MVRGVKAGEAFVEFFVDTKRLNTGLKKAEQRLKSFASAATRVGLQLTALGAALSTPFVLAAKEFINFETALSRIDVLLGKNSKSIQEFKKDIEGLAVKFGIEKEILVGGLEDILQASIDSAVATDVLVAAIKASQAGFTDVKTAADALTTVINSYGLTADKATQLSDILFTVVKRGKISFEQLASGIGNVSSIAATAGVSVQEMAAAIAVLTRNGIKSDEAITSLRAILVSFLKPQKDAVDLARTFGLELSSASLQTDGFLKSLKKIESLPPDVIARIFPNVRALKGVLPLLANLEGFGKDINAITKSAGTTDEAFNKITKTLGFLFRQINQIGKKALVIVGEALREDIEAAALAVRKFAVGFNVMLKSVSKVIPTLAKMALAITAIGIALVAIGAIALGFSIVIGVVISVINAFIFSIGLLISPIGLLGIAVAVLAGVLINKFSLMDKAVDIFKESIQRLSKTFGDAFSTIVASLKAGNIEGAFKILSASVSVIWKKMISTLIKASTDSSRLEF